MLSILLAVADATVETPTTAFLKAGILGAAIVVLAGVVVYLDHKAEKIRQQHMSDLAALQALRVVDAQAMSDRLLRVNDQVMLSLTNMARSSDASTQAMQELRTAFKDLGEEFRRNAPRR